MYQKISNNGKSILFSYTVGDIFDKASRKSAFNAKNVRDKEGNALVEHFAISEDDRDIFLQGVQSILPDINALMLKITSGMKDAFSFDENGAISISIQDNNAYNENLLSLVDTSIEECIIEGSLMEWYKSCTNADLLNLYSKSFGMSLEKLYDRLFQLRKKKVASYLCEC